MNITTFDKEEDTQAYLNWRKQNPQGFVLNINTWTPNSTSYKNIIHSANRCLSLDAPPSANRERPVTPEHPKLCSNDINDLVAEMQRNALSYKLCGHCMRGQKL